MKKFLVIDEQKIITGHESGDTFTNIFDTLSAANDAAQMQWAHLTKSEQAKRHVFVAYVEDNKNFLDAEAWIDEDGEECDTVQDWNAWHSIDFDGSMFNSDSASMIS